MPTSQAPSYDTLFNFEEIFEKAANDVIVAADLPGLAARSTDQVVPFQIAVMFDVGPANNDSKRTVGKDAENRNIVEYERYDACTLEIQIVGNRFDDAGSELPEIRTQLAEMRAAVRRLFRQSQWPLNDDNLKYYRVSRLRPNGTTSGQTQDKSRDVTTLRFQVDFCIMPDAWPAAA